MRKQPPHALQTEITVRSLMKDRMCSAAKYQEKETTWIWFRNLKPEQRALKRGYTDTHTGHLLQEKRLGLLLAGQNGGSSSRSCFPQLKDIDALTSFFFSLERSLAQRKQMTCLELPGSRVTTRPGEMRNHAVMEPWSATKGLLKGILQLSQGEKAVLTCELTLEEFTIAVNWKALGLHWLL